MISVSKRLGLIALAVIVAVLIVDQAVKIYVKTHFLLGEEVNVCGDWFKLHFVENNGMAFGAEFASGRAGKLFLSLFRIVAIGAIGYYLYRICQRGARTFFVILVSLVLSGAIGNIIDCIFYGVCFGSSWGQLAEFLPAGGGYGTWLEGRVVDMFYFPLLEGRFPDWLPIWGGEGYVFFRPVFNVADSAISVGIILMILFAHDDLGRLLNGDDK